MIERSGSLPSGRVSNPRPAKIFYDTLAGYLEDLSPTSRRFWLLVPLTGVIAGVSAVGMVHLLQSVEQWAWGYHGSILDATTHASPLRRVLVPTLGGIFIVAVSFVLGSPFEGHGTSQIIEAIWVRKGRVQVRSALIRGTLSLIVVGMGASLGREGALIYFGAASASFLGRRFRLEEDQLKLLVACGGAAGIAAAYNTPIGGALFGLEIFLGGLALDLYGPIIFATVTATVISRALLFDHPSYEIPHHRMHSAGEFPLYLLLGALTGLVSALFVRTIDATARIAHRSSPKLKRILPIFGLAFVGVAGLFYPELYGNGYETVNLALVGSLPLRLVFVLPLLKLLLTATTAASGAPGGLFTPSLFVGALIGSSFGAAAHAIAPHIVPATGGYVLVGMGAILAGTTHATFAAGLLLFELTGNYDLILPLLAACLVSTIVSRKVSPESIYTAPLKRRGIELPKLARPAWMQREGLKTLVRSEPVSVRPNESISEVLISMVRMTHDQLFVVDEFNRLLGVITIQAVRDALAEQGDLAWMVAADLMQKPPSVSIDASLWDVTRRALETEATRIAVVSPRDGGKFIGTVSIAEALAAARQSSSSSR